MCHLIFVIARYILLTIQIRMLCLNCIPLFMILLFYFIFSFLSSIVGLLKIWPHFMLMATQTSPSWWTNKGRRLSLTIVCVLCLFFNQVLYIYPRTSCMTLIIWFQVRYIRFLPPPLEGVSGLLVVAGITLLVIVWIITFKTPFSCWEL